MLKHMLAIGGTGMLRGAVISLLGDFDIVSVVCRSEESFNKLKEDSGSSRKLNWLKCDYTDYQNLTTNLIRTISELNEISMVLSWIHSSAPLAPVMAAKIINHQRTKCDYYDILGSAGVSRHSAFTQFENITYRTVQLGSVQENNVSRWLTHDEISSGIIEAYKNGHKEFTIGTL